MLANQLCSGTQGRQCGETRAHIKIHLPVFKDEDAKDAVTYQSWRWDLMVYHHAGCRDCTLLPYAIQSLQGYLRESAQSMGMDITLYNLLTILDEHYNKSEGARHLIPTTVSVADGG